MSKLSNEESEILDAFEQGKLKTLCLGDPIGLVGSSGLTQGAHLHYEVVKNGRRVNPWSYLGHDELHTGTKLPERQYGRSS